MKQKRIPSSQWGINDLPPEAIEFLPKTEENCNNGRTWKVFHHPSQGQRTLPQQRPLHQLERTSFQECWKHPRLPRGLTPPSFCLVSYHLSDCCHWKKGVILEYPGYFPALKWIRSMHINNAIIKWAFELRFGMNETEECSSLPRVVALAVRHQSIRYDWSIRDVWKQTRARTAPSPQQTNSSGVATLS